MESTGTLQWVYKASPTAMVCVSASIHHQKGLQDAKEMQRSDTQRVLIAFDTKDF